MKKLPLLFILLFTLTHAYSQDHGTEVFLGGSSSTLRGDIEDGLSRRVFVHGGVLFLMPLKDQFSIKAGFAYSGRGASEDGQAVKLNYLEVPLLFSYNLDKIDFFIGPQAAILLSSNTTRDNPRDFGLKYGFSVKLDSNVFIRASFYHGFSNVIDYPGVNITNRYISLVFGYRFGSHTAE